MIRAVFDTNIFVSAILRPRGVTADLVKMSAEGLFDLFVSSQIIDELEQVLRYPRIRNKYEIDDDTVEIFLGFLLETSSNVGQVPELFVVPGDPRDNPVVSTALACEADYLVTGDKTHLLSMGQVEGVKLLSPRDFLELMR